MEIAVGSEAVALYQRTIYGFKSLMKGYLALSHWDVSWGKAGLVSIADVLCRLWIDWKPACI